jgi:hypothetical protein
MNKFKQPLEMTKTFLISLKPSDPSRDYSEYRAFIKAFGSKSPVQENQQILEPSEEWTSAQQLRDALHPLLHPGDKCSVAAILDYVVRPSDVI